MTPEQEILMAILTNAHCTLKLFYATKKQEKTEQEVQEEVMTLFEKYADSDVVCKILKFGKK